MSPSTLWPCCGFSVSNVRQPALCALASISASHQDSWQRDSTCRALGVAEGGALPAVGAFDVLERYVTAERFQRRPRSGVTMQQTC